MQLLNETTINSPVHGRLNLIWEQASQLMIAETLSECPFFVHLLLHQEVELVPVGPGKYQPLQSSLYPASGLSSLHAGQGGHLGEVVGPMADGLLRKMFFCRGLAYC